MGGKTQRVINEVKITDERHQVEASKTEEGEGLKGRAHQDTLGTKTMEQKVLDTSLRLTVLAGLQLNHQQYFIGAVMSSQTRCVDL